MLGGAVQDRDALEAHQAEKAHELIRILLPRHIGRPWELQRLIVLLEQPRKLDHLLRHIGGLRVHEGELLRAHILLPPLRIGRSVFRLLDGGEDRLNHLLYVLDTRGGERGTDREDGLVLFLLVRARPELLDPALFRERQRE